MGEVHSHFLAKEKDDSKESSGRMIPFSPKAISLLGTFLSFGEKTRQREMSIRLAHLFVNPLPSICPSSKPEVPGKIKGGPFKYVIFTW